MNQKKTEGIAENLAAGAASCLNAPPRYYEMLLQFGPPAEAAPSFFQLHGSRYSKGQGMLDARTRSVLPRLIARADIAVE